ncbi:hypothetical protein [Aeromicrobium sp.]|uniref:hypothetical protein n=1 Tax=Aeromicrobium sp. TaxID=1871063 RepID=UPI0030C28B69
MPSVHKRGNDWLMGAPEQSFGRMRVRVQILLTTLLILTNVIGAGIVFGLTFLITPGNGPSVRFLTTLAIAVPVYVAVAVLIGASTVTVSALRALRWALEEREPTAEERRTALGLPLRLTLIQSSLWLGATILFPVLALIAQPEAALSSGFAVGIAGLVVSAIAYLITEFSLRPVAARALASRAIEDKLGAGVQRGMLTFWGLGTAAPVLGLVVSAIISLTRDESNATRLSFVVLGLALVVWCSVCSSRS